MIDDQNIHLAQVVRVRARPAIAPGAWPRPKASLR
jgi:hypothetical protein